MSAVAALVKRWRLHGATRMEHEQVIYERCADELEAAQPRFDETDDLTISSNCRNNALSAQLRPLPAVDEEMVRRGCEALAKRWRLGVPVGPTATEDVRTVLAAALLAAQPASAPVGVDGPVIGWLHEIEYADGWSGPRFVMGAEKPKAHLEQVRHPELIAPTIKGERFTPLTAALAQQPAAVDDPIARLIRMHADLLAAGKNYAYFELAYTRTTGWMAFITDKPLHGGPVVNPDRVVIARGQGDTPHAACSAALAQPPGEG